MLRNSGPILIDLDASGARIRQASLRGKDTQLDVTGTAGFGVKNPWDLRVRGSVNLAVLRDFGTRLYASGGIDVDVSVRGAASRPDLYGRIDFKNASLNFADFPNGIDNANGVIFLYRDRATIDTLTAETGGGKVSITGFAGFRGATNFHIRTKAAGVRVRYPEGVSSTMDAALSLTGTIDHSLLSGDAVVTRIGFNPRTDLGSLLARGMEPVPAPARRSRFEQGLHLDVHIVTSPEARFETTLTHGIQASADLRLRGGPVRPVLLGRVLINQGELIFLGNKYAINSGQIVFANAGRIEPTVNLDLETKVRGVEVTLHISGPVNKLNVTYRSDPPLAFSDIVALLATGQEPSTAPGVGGTQSQLSQSWGQAGAGALLSQAIASPIAGRLQRFFGVSQLKINPETAGTTTTNAAARVTLEQQITSNITFTYITDLSRAQAQTIRMELGFTPGWSAVALRDENGAFGVDFVYRKQFK